MRALTALTALAALTAGAQASKIELSTVPPREGVEVIVYRDVDLSLVREQRVIRFHKGMNDVAFSWADTHIDPTSVRIAIAGDGAGYTLAETTYPPEQPNTLVWKIEAPKDGPAPLEVRYFTSGLTWSASYTLVLSHDETQGTLSADFSVGNDSGEDYDKARVALLTGGVRLIEQVVALGAEAAEPLARSRRAGGRGGALAEEPAAPAPAAAVADSFFNTQDLQVLGALEQNSLVLHGDAPVTIAAATASEHERYNLDTDLALRTGWTTRLRFTESTTLAPKVLARVLLFSGQPAMRVVKVRNDKEHGLGGSPLPAGAISVFKRDPASRLVYLGESQMPYAGVGQEVEVLAGVLPDVVVEAKPLAMRKTSLAFEETTQALVGKVTETDYRFEARNRDGIARTLELIIGRPGEPNVFLGEGPVSKKTQGAITWEFGLKPNEAGIVTWSFHVYTGTAVNDMPKDQ